MIANNLKYVHTCIEKAAAAAGRDAKEVTLCPVSKTKPLEDVLTAYSCGERIFGENYVQEIREKYELMQKEHSDIPLYGPGCTDANALTFHMIGHLQTNKIKYIIDKVAMIHSVDSLHLAAAIDKEAEKKNLVMDILLEVNVAGEESKWGFTCESAKDALSQIEESYPHLRVRGLMTSAPYTEDPESNREHFRALSLLLKELRADRPYMDTLSMGMSGDYTVAVEEGATLVRVGTVIFGERDYSKQA